MSNLMPMLLFVSINPGLAIEVIKNWQLSHGSTVDYDLFEYACVCDWFISENIVFWLVVAGACLIKTISHVDLVRPDIYSSPIT